jgi:hypothetical protein
MASSLCHNWFLLEAIYHWAWEKIFLRKVIS